MGNNETKIEVNGNLVRSKSVSFKLPKWKEEKPNGYQIIPRSNTVRPKLTRERLFLPHFALPCLRHEKRVQVRPSDPVLGQGRFGIVYESHYNPIVIHNCQSCNDRGLFQQQQQHVKFEKVAVKVLKKASVIEHDSALQIIEEIRIHSVCSGLPHVLPFVKAWQSARHLHVAVALCQRGSLADLFMTMKTAFPSQTILIAAQQIFTGLKAIHNLGVIYRDVKLKNVLVSDCGNLMITDFGLAKWLSRRQRTNTICGTLAFMAPEVAQGLHYDHQVDLWSLGVLLYCLAFANYPFARAESHQGMAEILNDCANFEFSYESDEKVQILLENLLKFNPQERSFKLDFQSELALTFYESLRINGKVA